MNSTRHGVNPSGLGVFRRMQVPLLTSKRLYLRKFSLEDYEAVYDMLSNAATMKYTSFKTPQTKEVAQNLLSRWSNEANELEGAFAIVEVQDKEVVGWIMLKATKFDAPEIGFMLRHQYQSKGYISEISEALIDTAFNTNLTDRIYAVSHQDNQAFIKVLQRLGFVRSSRKLEDDELVVYVVNKK